MRPDYVNFIIHYKYETHAIAEIQFLSSRCVWCIAFYIEYIIILLIFNLYVDDIKKILILNDFLMINIFFVYDLIVNYI